MQTFLSPLRDHAYTALRIVAGLLFACHGLEKVFGILRRSGGERGAEELFSFMWFAGLIEVVGGLLIMVGFLTGFAAFICSGMMAVAYFMVHQFNGDGFWPIENGGELAVLYCFLFLFIATVGSGKGALDRGSTLR